VKIIHQAFAEGNGVGHGGPGAHKMGGRIGKEKPKKKHTEEKRGGLPSKKEVRLSPGWPY